MNATRASAPGKIILFGEHAVVYGQPALAVPVTQVQATATIEPSDEWTIDARDLGRLYRLEEAPTNNPLAAVIRLTLTHLNISLTRHVSRVTIFSTIPIASGLGSGAAVSAAIVRALSEYLGQPLTDAEVSALVFETEKLLHGTPSGIDNTVIAYQRPVYFIKGQPPIPLQVAQPFRLLIGDTGISSPTKITVGDVRAAHEKEPERYQQLFNQIGAIANKARIIIEAGDPLELGPLMKRNHDLLREIGVSSTELDTLVSRAHTAGALGAKLSGGGRGGNMIALVTSDAEARVRGALEEAGAKRVIETTVDGGRKTEDGGRMKEEGRRKKEESRVTGHASLSSVHRPPSSVFLKLGGSLITDKSTPRTPRPEALARLMDEIAQARNAKPELRIVLGHGSGSFGHMEAHKYGTRAGVRTNAEWQGFAEVQAAAGQLNRIVADAARAAGLPIVNFPPSASTICHDGVIQSFALEPMQAVLEHNLIPLVFGDVAMDEVRGGTIVSTEDVFRYLALHLKPERILIAGIERGVLTRWPEGEVMPEITPQTHLSNVGSSHAADVTGGMASKVQEMLALTAEVPGLTAQIFSGEVPGHVRAALLDEVVEGTVIFGSTDGTD